MKNIFPWEKIQTNKTSGKTKATCPVCIDRRSDKRDKSLQVDFTKGIAHCHYCHAISFRDSIEKKTEQQNFVLPSQNWKNYTKLSDKMTKYLEGRGISQFTIKEFELTEEKHYQPQLNREVNNLVFNYFEGNVLVNKKYRSASKKFTQTTNAKSIFYNINSVIGAEEAWIVEGEIDVLSMSQIGIKNCISIPNGANDNDNYWQNSERYIKDIKKFYIATDNDEKGDEVAEKIAQRLGRWRCERIVFEGKDANDDLVAGVLEKSVLNRRKYPVSGTFSVFDIYDDIIDLYKNGLPPTIFPKHRSFGHLRDIFSVMRGHLCTVTGIPSHGKSDFVEWYVLNLVNDYNMKCSYFSPEHQPVALHQTRFIEKVFAKNFWEDYPGVKRVSQIEVAQYAEWANEKIYITCPDDGEVATWDWLLDKFKEQMITYGTDIFIIDAFNKVAFNDSKSPLQQINDVLTRLTSFAQNNNVIIFLVAHPTKMKKNAQNLYEVPTLYDVSGSADFRNQTHDGFCIYRFFEDDKGNENKTIFVNLKTKMKFQGEINGVVEFEYHAPSGRFYEMGSDLPLFNLITGEEPNYDKPSDDNQIEMFAEVVNEPIIDQIEGDDDNDDVPF